MSDKFVCLSDITNTREDINTVIFNPNIDNETNRKVIVETIKRRFDLDIPSDLVDMLLCNDKYSLETFVCDLKKYVNTNRLK